MVHTATVDLALVGDMAGGDMQVAVGFYGRHGRFRYYGAFVDPYWNPYYYPFAGTVSYPVKTVSFQRGRVVAFQLLTPSAY